MRAQTTQNHIGMDYIYKDRFADPFETSKIEWNAFKLWALNQLFCTIRNSTNLIYIYIDCVCVCVSIKYSVCCMRYKSYAAYSFSLAREMLCCYIIFWSILLLSVVVAVFVLHSHWFIIVQHGFWMCDIKLQAIMLAVQLFR